MALNPGLELPFGIQPTNPVPVDAYKGPYVSVAEANASIPLAVRYQGQEVIIITGGLAEKYTYAAGTADGNLVPFSAGTVYTFSQGVQESAGTVTLGGDITSPVELIVDAFGDTTAFTIIDNFFYFGFSFWPDLGTSSGPFAGGAGVGFFLQGDIETCAYWDGGTWVIGSTADFNLQKYSGGGTQMLVVNNFGTVQAQALPSGVAGANTQVQFNNSGAFGASANFTYSSVSNELMVGELLLTGGILEFTPTDSLILAAENLEFESSVASSVFNIGANFGNITITALSGVGTRMVVADASGILSTQAIPSGGVPAGASGQIQYNNAGAFDASANLTFNPGPGLLLITDPTEASTITSIQGGQIISRTSTSNTQFFIDSYTDSDLPTRIYLRKSNGTFSASNPATVNQLLGQILVGTQTTSPIPVFGTYLESYSGISNYTIGVRFLLSNSGGGSTLELGHQKIGFFATTPIAKPTVTGSRGGNAALASLLTELANLGLVTDSTTA